MWAYKRKTCSCKSLFDTHNVAASKKRCIAFSRASCAKNCQRVASCITNPGSQNETPSCPFSDNKNCSAYFLKGAGSQCWHLSGAPSPVRHGRRISGRFPARRGTESVRAAAPTKEGVQPRTRRRRDTGWAGISPWRRECAIRNFHH